MLIYILLILFVAMLVLSYRVFNREIVNPSVIFCFMYTLSILSAIYNISAWNIDLVWKTFFILFLGGVEFILISYIIKKKFEKKYADIEENKKKDTVNFVLNKYIMILLSVFSIVVIGILVFNIYKIASQFGAYNNFTEAQRLFKSHTSYSNDASLPSYLPRLLKILELSSYICLYSFLYNVINSSEKKLSRIILKNIYYIVPVIFYIASEFISSSRITTIQLGCAGIVMGLIIWHSKYEWKKHIEFKFIGKMILIGVVCLVAFYYSAALIGRENSKGMLDYITLYAGGSIECLNQYVKEPITQSQTKGSETFILLMRGLNKYGVTHFNLLDSQTPHLEFRYYNDNMIGNVYTAYRRWYNDFGVIGIAVLNGFMAFVFNTLYYLFKYRRLKKYNHLVMIIFGYISYAIFLHPVDSYFYTTVFQITFGTNLILFTILYILFFVIKYDKENKKINFGNTPILSLNKYIKGNVKG